MIEESKVPASAMKVSAFTPKQPLTKEPEDLSSLVDPDITASAMQVKTTTTMVQGAGGGGGISAGIIAANAKEITTAGGAKGFLSFEKNPEAEAIV